MPSLAGRRSNRCSTASPRSDHIYLYHSIDSIDIDLISLTDTGKLGRYTEGCPQGNRKKNKTYTKANNKKAYRRSDGKCWTRHLGGRRLGKGIDDGRRARSLGVWARAGKLITQDRNRFCGTRKTNKNVKRER